MATQYQFRLSLSQFSAAAIITALQNLSAHVVDRIHDEKLNARKRLADEQWTYLSASAEEITNLLNQQVQVNTLLDYFQGFNGAQDRPIATATKADILLLRGALEVFVDSEEDGIQEVIPRGDGVSAQTLVLAREELDRKVRVLCAGVEVLTRLSVMV